MTPPVPADSPLRVVVLICAGAEWRAVRPRFPGAAAQASPYREWLETPLPGLAAPAVFMHTGWGKIAAAGAAQYALDRWHPDLLVNLGTCGGVAGAVQTGEILLVDRTVVYDIASRMETQPDTSVARYTTTLDLTWLREPYPLPVRRALMLSADRDLDPADLPALRARYAGLAADWESGAIAYVAARNACPCLIVRAVSDLVGPAGGEADANYALFAARTAPLMDTLVGSLPAWLAQVDLR